MSVKTLKKGNAEELMVSENNIASPEISSVSAALAIIEYIVPSVNKLLESNIELLSESFSRISQSNRNLNDFLNAKNGMVEKSEITGFLKEISEGVSGAIIGMQFQDRVSQNLVIVNDISNKLNKFIEENDLVARGQVNHDLSKDVLGLIKLGEIRDKYLEVLVGKGFIKDPSELGFVASQEAAKADDVELF